MENLLVLFKNSGDIVFVSYRVYILRCGDGTFYTGQTTDLDKRLTLHNSGRGARYTRGRGPLELVYHVGVGTLREAFVLERKIKRLPRTGKEKLIATFQPESSSRKHAIGKRPRKKHVVQARTQW